MQITLETDSSGNFIQGVSPGEIKINNVVYRGHLVLTRQHLIPDWAVAGAERLSSADFSWLAEFKPELIVLGTGLRQYFPPVEALQPLIARQIGIEIMTTPNACHTYNVLAYEGRNVLVALIND